MDKLQIFSYKNNPVSFKNIKGEAYINATEMAKPFGKRPAKWLELPSTQELINALEIRNSNVRKSDISNNQLIKAFRGSPLSGGGTWMHEDLALDFAQWLSVDFKIWCNDRIKELMRYGVTASENMLNQIFENPDIMIELLISLKKEREENALQSKKIEEHKKIIEKQAPKVMFADAVASSDKSCLVKELATILKQNGMDIGQNRLFAMLRGYGYLCTKGENYNLPTQRSMDLGLFEIKQTVITKPNGTVLKSRTTKVTGKGQVYFVNKFLKAEKDGNQLPNIS